MPPISIVKQRFRRMAQRATRAEYGRIQKAYPLPRRKFRLPPLGMPAKQVVRLRYVDEVTLNAGLVPVVHYFSANGMYDPNVTGVGHQPLYFDQFMVNYDHYMVTGSKIKVTCLPSQSTGATPGCFGVIIDDETTFSYTTTDQIIESNQNGSKWRMCSAQYSGINTKGKSPSVTRTFSAQKLLGDKTDKHEGSVTSNPPDQMFYGVWYGGVAGNDSNAAAFLVEIEYIALLKEPKFVAQS